MPIRLYIFLLTIRNVFLRPFFYTGPTLVCCKKNEGGWENQLTTGKIYYSERRDWISYYLKDDNGQLCEVVKTRLTLIKKIK